MEQQKLFSFPDLVVDVPKHEVLVKGHLIELTAKEFKLLCFFIKNNGIAFDRDRLLRSVWGKLRGRKTRTIDVHIRRIRKKLGESSRYLLTLRGVGYKFKANPIAL
jgi:DNA-binding response OmpR family regulator